MTNRALFGIIIIAFELVIIFNNSCIIILIKNNAAYIRQGISNRATNDLKCPGRSGILMRNKYPTQVDVQLPAESDTIQEDFLPRESEIKTQIIPVRKTESKSDKSEDIEKKPENGGEAKNEKEDNNTADGANDKKKSKNKKIKKPYNPVDKAIIGFILSLVSFIGLYAPWSGIIVGFIAIIMCRMGAKSTVYRFSLVGFFIAVAGELASIFTLVLNLKAMI